MFRKEGKLPLIRDYLVNVQGGNLAAVNEALNGAGWSASSDPSNAVVPRPQAKPSIVITGARDGQRIEVSGSTTGFGMGAILNPWVRLAGQSAYSQGSAQVLVSMDGTFSWGRTTGKKAAVYMQTPDGSVRSNTVKGRASPTWIGISGRGR